MPQHGRLMRSFDGFHTQVGRACGSVDKERETSTRENFEATARSHLLPQSLSRNDCLLGDKSSDCTDP